MSRPVLSLCSAPPPKRGARSRSPCCATIVVRRFFLLSTIPTKFSYRYFLRSTNQIDKMISLPGLKNLQILSLGRNQIKRIQGLEEVGATLQELWISYNHVSTLDGLHPCVK